MKKSEKSKARELDEATNVGERTGFGSWKRGMYEMERKTCAHVSRNASMEGIAMRASYLYRRRDSNKKKKKGGRKREISLRLRGRRSRKHREDMEEQRGSEPISSAENHLTNPSEIKIYVQERRTKKRGKGNKKRG